MCEHYLTLFPSFTLLFVSFIHSFFLFFIYLLLIFKMLSLNLKMNRIFRKKKIKKQENEKEQLLTLTIKYTFGLLTYEHFIWLLSTNTRTQCSRKFKIYNHFIIFFLHSSSSFFLLLL